MKVLRMAIMSVGLFIVLLFGGCSRSEQLQQEENTVMLQVEPDVETTGEKEQAMETADTEGKQEQEQQHCFIRVRQVYALSQMKEKLSILTLMQEIHMICRQI